MCGTHASGFCFSDELCCIAFNLSYTYDALGNLFYRQLPNGDNQYYKYDLENQLVHTEIKKSRQQTHYFHCEQIGISKEMTQL